MTPSSHTMWSQFGDVDLLNPKSCNVQLDRIAEPLSRICRYTGHIPRHYSVAEHSLAVCQWSQVVADEKGFRNAKVVNRIRLWALLHDAHEVFVGDISSPMKNLLREHDGFQIFNNIDLKWQLAVRDEYVPALSLEEFEIVKQADREVAAAEMLFFFGRPTDGYVGHESRPAAIEMLLDNGVHNVANHWLDASKDCHWRCTGIAL